MKRSRKGRARSDAPLPLPGTGRFPRYAGTLSGSSVIVADAEQGADLFLRGAYGKGLLSRSRPCYFIPSGRRKGRSVLEAPFFGGRTLHPPPEAGEPLVLSLEEACWLAGPPLAVLDVAGHTAESLRLEACRRDAAFPATYAAYRHFRERSWSPKSGLKYGVSFLLYKTSPVTCHASHQVLVVARRAGSGEIVEALTPRGEPLWRNVSTLNRIAAGVAKEMCLCTVTVPEGWRHGDPLTQVDLIVVRRWKTHRRNRGDGAAAEESSGSE